MHHSLRTRVVSRQDLATGDIERTSDIDSVLVCAKTLRPFRCISHASINLSPVNISRTQNDKLDIYLRVVRRQQSRDTLDTECPLLEFPLGYIDARPVYVAFQLAANSDVLAELPDRRTRDSPGRNVIARRLFLERIVCEAARRMHVSTRTAQTGLPVQWMAVEGTFHIPATEFPEYSGQLAAVLRETSVGEECGMTYVRFYTCEHGIRLSCHEARAAIDATTDVDHPDVDVVQLHRADQLKPQSGDAYLMVHLAGRGSGTLASSLPTAHVGKLERYRLPLAIRPLPQTL